MATEVTMPRLSDSMEEGTILRWLKSVGEEVHRGDELVEIETDKANMTYESVDDGVLVEVVAAEGNTLPIGEVIARIGAPEEMNGAAPRGEEGPKKEEPAVGSREAADESAVGSPESGVGSRQSAAPQTADGRRQTAEPDGRVKASPVARRMAR